MSGPLADRCVVVTRPRSQSGELVGRLEALGARVRVLPLIEIVPIGDAPDLDRALGALDAYDVLVVTSANAADLLAARLRGRGATVPGDVLVVAVGDATAGRLAAHGIPVDLIPPRATGEDIVSVLRDRGVAGARVLLPRARRGRPELPRGLRRAGAHVDDIALYDTAPLTPAAGDAEAALAADAVILTAPSAVESLAAAARGRVGEVRAVTIGPVTSAAARAAGMRVVAEAAEQSVDGIVRAVLDAGGDPAGPT